MIAQDTGSAIVGPARGDLFFGSGDAAGSHRRPRPPRGGDVRAARRRRAERRMMRRLRAEERELWDKLRGTVKPLPTPGSEALPTRRRSRPRRRTRRRPSAARSRRPRAAPLAARDESAACRLRGEGCGGGLRAA